MATKKHRLSPLEEPPSASSSSDEENSSEASSEEEAEEVQAKNPPPSSSNPKLPSSSGSDSESGSESESNSESITNTNAANTLALKPMKVQTTPSPRVTENNNGTDSDSKQRSKKKDVGKSLAFTEMIRFNDEIGSSWLNMGAMKRGMELIGESDNAMLAERWKKVRIAEMKVVNTRAELVRDLTASIIEAYKNSN